MVIFGINCPKRVYPLNRFLQNFAFGRESQNYTPIPNLTIVALKMWPYGSKNRQKWQFLVQICQSGKILGVKGKLEYRCTTTNLPLCNDIITIFFTKLRAERMSRVRTLTPNFTVLTQLTAEKNRRNLYFLYILPKSDFLKIKREGGYPRSIPSGQILPLSLLKCGLTTPKIAEIGNFWYKFAKKGYNPLSDFFYKILIGGGVPGSHPHAKFRHRGLKMWEYSPKIAKIGIFWYKFAQNGYIPLSDFYKIWLERANPRSAPSCQISPLWL